MPLFRRHLPAPETPLTRSTGGRRVYAVGDVHGRFDLLKQLLAEIETDRRSLRPVDPAMVFCGDYVDRGPHSAQVVECLLWLERNAPYELVLLKGNHEAAMLDFLESPAEAAAWLNFGGAETLASYGVEPPAADGGQAELLAARDALAKNLPESHRELIESLRLMHAVGDYVFVHAGVRPGRPLDKQIERDLLWIRRDFLEAESPFEQTIVHGHTWLDERPQLAPGRIGLDTGAYATGVLTAAVLQDGEVVFLQARGAPGVSPTVSLGPLRGRTSAATDSSTR